MFKGILDGNGYSLRNFNRVGGLIDSLEGGVIKNLDIRNSVCTTEKDAVTGILVNSVTATKDGGNLIDHCEVEDDQTSISSDTISEDSVVSALIGEVKKSEYELVVRNCEVGGSMSIQTACLTGGLIGTNAGIVRLENCLFAGTISDRSSHGDIAYGAFVGKNASADGTDTGTVSFHNCVLAGGYASTLYGKSNILAVSQAEGVISGSRLYYITDQADLTDISDQVECIGVDAWTGMADTLNDNLQEGYVTWVNNTHTTGVTNPYLSDYTSVDYVHTASLAENDSGTAGFDTPGGTQTATAYAGTAVTCYIEPSQADAGTMYVSLCDSEGTVLSGVGYIWNESEGYYEASFIMPDEDVEIRYEFVAEDEVTDYAVAAEVTPEEEGNAWITDADGNEVTWVSEGETVYLNVDLREGYAVQSILLYSGSSSAYYKAVEAQADDSGRYAFTVDGAEAGKLVTAKVQLGMGTYTISTKNQGTGYIQLSDTTAQMGDTIHVRAVPTDGYFVSQMYLADTDGNKIESLWVEYSSAGYSETEFSMPGKNVVVCTVFTSKSYTVEVETNDENVTINVRDEDGNNISRARTGSTVTVSWDLNKVMIDSLTVCRDDEERTVIEKLDTSGNKNQASFTMPAENVVIVANADETEYLLSRATEGEGYVLLNDLTTFDKTEGKAGQTIFAALYPAEGWELMEGSQVIDEEGNVLAELTESKKYAVFTMPQSDITLTGGFTAIDYTITVEAADHETIEVLKDGEAVTTANKDDVLTVQAASDSYENLAGVTYTYEYGGETQTLTAAVSDGAAEITMPAADITITASYTDYDFDTDEDGAYLISDFETLTDVAKAIQAEPDIYASATYRLTNPIHADGAEWTLPIGTADVPFVGTFDGAGYFLIDYVIDTDEDNMAIFGVVGEGGSVLNMGATMGTITSAGNLVAELVAVNYGTVNGCYSGCALTSGSITLKDGNVHSLSELNTTVTGAAGAAGLVAENYGTVINSRSHSSVSGLNAGGLVLYNYGTIENAYNYGSVTGTLSAGGIAGENEGSIFNVYDTGKITSSGTAGVITAVNTGTVSDEAYYDHYQASAPSYCEVGTAMDLKAMKKDTFMDTLNANITEAERDDLYEWIRSSDKNGGYPRISSPVVVSQTLTSASLNLSVSGTMHQESSLEATALTEESEAYEAFAAYAGDENTIVRTADAALIYMNGDYAEYEGGLTVTVNSVPDSLENVKLLKYSDGEVSEVTFEKSGDTCTLEVQELVPVALVATAASDTDDGTEATADAAGDSDTSDSGSSSGSSSSGSGTSKVKTGDSDLFLPMIGLILAAAAAGGVCAAKKRRRERA